MAHSPQIDGHDDAGRVPRPELARPDLKVGVARIREALVPEIGSSELDPETPDSCFGRVQPELSRRVHIVAAPAIEQVAT